MRVTNKMMIDNMIRNMADNQESLSILNEKSASGKAFKYASEDPSTVSSVLNIRTSITMSDTYMNTAKTSSDWMSATESAFEQMVKLCTRSINVAKSGLSDSLSAEERANSMGTEMEEILSNAVEIGNSTHQENYIFAGFQVRLSSDDPFLLNADNSVTYRGDAGVIKREIGPNQSITINSNGNTAFQDFFAGLSEAITALNTNNTANLQTAIASLESASDKISEARTSNAARSSQLTNTITRMTKSQIELKALLSGKENVNAAEVISQLTYQETVYKSVLEVAQRTISASNLFDYLG